MHLQWLYKKDRSWPVRVVAYTPPRVQKYATITTSNNQQWHTRHPEAHSCFLPRPSRKSANRAMAFEFALHRNGQPIFTSTFASSSPSTLSLQLDNSIFFPAWVTGIATAVRLTRKGVRFFPRETPHRLGSESPVSSRLIRTIDSFQRDSAANCHYITRFIGKSSLHL